ncbi:hypothetical protein Rsub_03134 [Raphidocelis subcapitata]|uniref:Rieske domain-containing protein n=1 Tax=Raphidocelis subcapitata TaxID=307507 RepID=A0A2V0NV59_9CHLO|nr:hypothetical protein Rsub_03134 [Raphidocelis subcapitata]|eukprot:GBF90562.1 hypothetical protein Rsub_03134 [Raphidocelis subcapitata]
MLAARMQQRAPPQQAQRRRAAGAAPAAAAPRLPARPTHWRRAVRTASTTDAGAPVGATATAPRPAGGEGAPAAAPAPAPGIGGDAFSWHRAWWPVAVESQLDPSRPTAAMVLGVPLVIWRPAEGGWAVLEDRCPHRLAPLSEGRIEPSDSTLQCVYHGWRFDGSGACRDIPQIEDPKARATACSSGRACARSFPCQAKGGLLWVWMDAKSPPPPDAAPPVAEEIGREGWTLLGGDWFMRDLEYGFDTLHENLHDPSHIPFTHHGIMGNARREIATPLGEIKTEAAPSAKGFRLWRDTAPFKIPSRMETVNNFVAPCLNSTVQKTATGRTFMLQFYGVPVAPGKSKLFAGFVTNAKLPPLARKLAGAFDWVFHLGQQVVLDSDAYLLHVQERLLQASPAGGWRQSFYLPATADTGIITFRTWMDQVGGGSIPWPLGTDARLGPALPREVVMDRWAQHCRHCKSCRRAVTWIERLRAACTAAAAVAAPVGAFALLAAAAGAWPGAGAGAAGAGGWGPAAPLGLACLALAAAALLARRALQRLWSRFHFTDYVHADVK